MTSSWHTYPSIYALGHHAISDLLLDPVLIEEKIDGSQFSFGRFPEDPDTPNSPLILRCRSKGAVLNVLAPDAMFKRAVDIVRELPLQVGWTYRAEYVMKPKHNTLAYDRVPANLLILFDINPSEEEYLSYPAKQEEAQRLGLETVPCLFEGSIDNAQVFRHLLETPSCLGGQKVEGLVVKNYHRFGRDKHVLMGKFVSEAFKEVHGATWRTEHPGPTDILTRIGDAYRTPARWQKALQHLHEAGGIEGSPRDIGGLIPAVIQDVQDECQQEIQEALFKWAWPHLRRSLTRGLPEWYKERLLEKQCGGTP